MDDGIWFRGSDRPHFHLRLIAWATRRCERREGTVAYLFRKLAA